MSSNMYSISYVPTIWVPTVLVIRGVVSPVKWPWVIGVFFTLTSEV